jgi:hypothetical protein
MNTAALSGWKNELLSVAPVDSDIYITTQTGSFMIDKKTFEIKRLLSPGNRGIRKTFTGE